VDKPKCVLRIVGMYLRGSTRTLRLHNHTASCLRRGAGTYPLPALSSSVQMALHVTEFQ
jgi:hypothetical protein